MKKQDFSKQAFFPGTIGNPFDRILRFTEDIEKLPGFVFLISLGLIAFLVNLQNLTNAILFLLFFLGDWLLISLLPQRGRSFGPAKPPALILAFMRTFFFLIIPGPAKLIIQGIGTLLVIYGFWIEPHQIKISKQNLKTDKIGKGNRFTFVHLSDLHLEKTTAREKQLLRLLQDIKPDLILFSGDFLNLSYIRDEAAIHDAAELVSQWTANKGIYCVTGSPAVDLPESVEQILGSSKTINLNNDCTKIDINGDSINLYGIYCSHKPHIDAEELKKINHHDSERLKILLYHSPDLAPEAAEAGMDIMISGHTHGGQVRLPLFGALFTGSLYGKKFETGPYQLDQMRLYVSRGIGMEGAGAPRVRFLCPPEIIVWNIEGI